MSRRCRCAVLVLAFSLSGTAFADCPWWKGILCFPAFSSCGLTAGFGGPEPYLRCVDTLSKHECTDCILKAGLDPRGMYKTCPNGLVNDQAQPCPPEVGRSALTVPSTFAARVVGPNQDGRLEVVAVAQGSGVPFHIWQSSAPSQWDPSVALFPTIPAVDTSPALSRRADGKLDVHVVSRDGKVRRIRQAAPNVNWGAWNVLPGVSAKSVATGVDADGRALIVVIATDGALWFTKDSVESDEITGWRRLGGTFDGIPAVATNLDGRLEIFARAATGRIWHTWQLSPGGGWSALTQFSDERFVGNPVVSHNQDGRLELFVTSASRELHHRWQVQPNLGWSEWAKFVGTHSGDIAVGMNVDGTMDVFAVGINDRAVWHIRQASPNSGWGDWQSLGGIVKSTPKVASNNGGTLDVFAIGQDGAIWHARQKDPAGQAWTAWERLGGTANPAAF